MEGQADAVDQIESWARAREEDEALLKVLDSMVAHIRESAADLMPTTTSVAVVAIDPSRWPQDELLERQLSKSQLNALRALNEL